eukprot:TRINITY_DN5010_c2_g1_i1.p1 TRINITY_DN5010_c2_g1~~TRINITY_DN5010_c2_g1_i1.p1  ORF type:complete len:374 (+),score=45.52 TRINITY_DN5010_c2_g1_i1:358-1479(+)
MCKKAHAHFREIIANSRAPLRLPYRVLSRGWQIALRSSGWLCWELWQMSSAAAEVREMYNEVRASCKPGQPCSRCKQPKQDVEAIAADISQLFKDVDPQEVIRCAQRLCNHCADHCKMKGVTVLPGRRCRGFLGGSPFTKKGMYFSFEDMVQFITYYLTSAYFLVGKVVVLQKLGVPMGGGASKISSSLLLCWLEHDWLTNVDRRISAGFSSDEDFHASTKGKRYVDDLLLMSSSLCQRCLEQLLFKIYPQPLVCGVESRGPTMEWLDMVLDISNGLSIQQKRPQAYMKQALTPYLIDDGGCKERLWWWISSRIHRAQQIYAPEESEFVNAVGFAVSYAVSAGYPIKLAWQVASKLRHVRAVNMYLRKRRQFH